MLCNMRCFKCKSCRSDANKGYKLLPSLQNRSNVESLNRKNKLLWALSAHTVCKYSTRILEILFWWTIAFHGVIGPENVSIRCNSECDERQIRYHSQIKLILTTFPKFILSSFKSNITERTLKTVSTLLTDRKLKLMIHYLNNINPIVTNPTKIINISTSVQSLNILCLLIIFLC